MDAQWTIRCRVCNAQLGPYFDEEQVARLVDGGGELECGHRGATVESQAM